MTFPDILLYDFSDDKHSLDEIADLLGKQRYDYCRRMKSEKAGLASAFAFLLLRYGLKKYYGIADIPELTFGEHGKPFLKEYPGLYFSMSHARSRSVCTISEVPIGVDIQDIRPLSASAAAKFLTDTESGQISAEDSTALCRAWSIKESYSKMTGKGFSEGFTNIDTGKLIRSGTASVTEKDGYIISICMQE